jgi:hypothetical protein
VNRAPAALSGTSLEVIAPKGCALPFAPLEPTAPPPSPPGRTEVLPRPARPGTADEAAALSLEQYASLCVEIAADPGKAEAVLRRYHLTAEQREAIDAYWLRRMATDPTVWLAFDRASSTYRTFYLAQRAK